MFLKSQLVCGARNGQASFKFMESQVNLIVHRCLIIRMFRMLNCRCAIPKSMLDPLLKGCALGGPQGGASFCKRGMFELSQRSVGGKLCVVFGNFVLSFGHVVHHTTRHIILSFVPSTVANLCQML